jgi:hypothetical protein
MMYADSQEQVLQTDHLLGEILKRISGSKALLAASHVSSLWRTTARNPTVISGFTSRNRPCFIGFVVEHAQGAELQLIRPPGTSSMDDPARELQERFVPYQLYDKQILGTYGGRVICRMESGKRKGKLYTNCPYSSNPSLFNLVGRPIVAMEKNQEDNRYGQFAVLEPTDGPNGGFPVFFVKDESRDYSKDHLGVKFLTGGRVRLHVCVLSKGEWTPHVYDLSTPPSPCTFQRSPYCVQAGCRLYMMYLVGLIVCFDVKEKTFGVVPLPGQMASTVKGCLEYTVGPHPEGDLAVVHFEDRRLVRWVLTRKGDMAEWYHDIRVDLPAAFGYTMNTDILDALSVQPSDWHAIQVRSVSPDGRYVLISVGVVQGLYLVDMVYEMAEAFGNLSKMGRVFLLSEYWPSKP